MASNRSKVPGDQEGRDREGKEGKKIEGIGKVEEYGRANF
jgi:hypothetical protein